MRITAAGDCAAQRNLPKYYEGFAQVRDYIAQGDVRFFNMETTVCEDCAPAAHSGGTWMRTSRDVLEDMLEFGFNITTPANNHCFDFGENGFVQTLENFRALRIRQCGGGMNLAQAAAPAYLDTPAGRAAVIACSMDFSPGAQAGEQSRDFPGRPGINPVRLEETVYVTSQDLEALSDIARRTGVNAYNDIIRAEGYLPPLAADALEMCGTKFRVGQPGVTYQLSKADMQRLETAIRDARFQADVVLISVHSHMCCGSSKEAVPAFLEEFAHRCIDAGAHAVLGHGPHLLRAVELYKGLPIFYSLGDFVLQLENCTKVPYDYYRKYGVDPSEGLYEVFRKRTRDFTVGLQRQQVMLEAVIPYFEIEDGKLTALRLLPIELGYGQPHSRIGLPRVAEGSGILERLAELSAPYGTVIAPDGTVMLG